MAEPELSNGIRSYAQLEFACFGCSLVREAFLFSYMCVFSEGLCAEKSPPKSVPRGGNFAFGCCFLLNGPEHMMPT
eukprot:10438120-Alexandrium_andersonii.AAC.1